MDRAKLIEVLDKVDLDKVMEKYGIENDIVVMTLKCNFATLLESLREGTESPILEQLARDVEKALSIDCLEEIVLSWSLFLANVCTKKEYKKDPICTTSVIICREAYIQLFSGMPPMKSIKAAMGMRKDIDKIRRLLEKCEKRLNK